MFRTAAALLSTVLLTSCVSSSLNDLPVDTPIDLTLPEAVVSLLPEAIEASVRTDYAAFRQIPEIQVAILRYSPEIWRDGCLGLGRPEESCLFALAEGWQVEATDLSGTESSFYRTDVTGEHVRRSTLENNLPPSVGDRVLQILKASGAAQNDSLSIVSAEPQLWDGCYGLPSEGSVCAEVAIFGWRVTLTDTRRYWVYHTDGLGNTILLNGEAREAKMPGEALTSETLEVDDFSSKEMLDQVGPGCSIVLRRTAEAENFILHENYLEEGNASMKVAGNWITFLPESFAVGISQHPTRTFVSEDNQLQLTLNTPAGERQGYELIDIPEATIEISAGDGTTTAISAVGEAGC